LEITGLFITEAQTVLHRPQCSTPLLPHYALRYQLWEKIIRKEFHAEAQRRKEREGGKGRALNRNGTMPLTARYAQRGCFKKVTVTIS